MKVRVTYSTYLIAGVSSKPGSRLTGRGIVGTTLATTFNTSISMQCIRCKCCALQIPIIACSLTPRNKSDRSRSKMGLGVDGVAEENEEVRHIIDGKHPGKEKGAVFTSRSGGIISGHQIDVPSSISTLELSPKNRARCATTSLAMMSKSRIFLPRRPERTSFSPSQNCFRCSPVNSSGEPSDERTASSRSNKSALGQVAGGIQLRSRLA